MREFAKLSDNDMLARLAAELGCDEVSVFKELLRFRGRDPADAYYDHHLFVVGGRSGINGIAEFYEQCHKSHSHC